MNSKRIGSLNQKPMLQSGRCVLYVMSRDQRVNDNHALLRAQEIALEHDLPLVVLFVLYKKTGHRTREQYQFMLEGLEEVQEQLNTLNITFILRAGKPVKEVQKCIDDESPAAVVFDFSPLSGPRSVAKKIASQNNMQCEVVDTHNIVPIWVTSQKREYAAHTIRSKIHKNLQDYVEEPTKLTKMETRLKLIPNDITFDDAYELIESIPESGAAYSFMSGEAAARKHVADFIDNRLERYGIDRNNPNVDGVSGLSPYLHFGQISALRVALEVIIKSGARPLLYDQGKLAQSGDTPSVFDGMNALLEEMIVRKELADNFCFYSNSYTDIATAENWAQQSLVEHEDDEREHVYSRKEWEAAETHDPAWNAAQKEMMKTGKMHGYMRMYWAKKILEWSKNPAEALRIAIYLNDKYSIDGGDPNGYVGILWSIAGVHDRPWVEREVFGKIRYMNFGGLKRRFDVEEYIEKWTSNQASLLD